MARWSIEFLPEAEKDLVNLDSGIRHRIIAKLEWLQENFDSIIPSVLTGEFRDFYKLRVGDWRIFYRVRRENCLIIICYIDRRDKAYKWKT